MLEAKEIKMNVGAQRESSQKSVIYSLSIARTITNNDCYKTMALQKLQDDLRSTKEREQALRETLDRFQAKLDALETENSGLKQRKDRDCKLSYNLFRSHT